MRRIFITSFCLFLTLLIATSSATERFLLMKIGPTWPRALLKTKKSTAWDAQIATGITFDEKISVGGGIDFMWNQNTNTTKEGVNYYRVESSEKTFMFPLSGYLSISPIPDFIVHPVMSGQIGVSTMYFSHKEESDSIPTSDLKDENGWYMGFYWKIALDAVFDLGPNTGVFAGIDYNWTKPKKIGDKEEFYFVQRDMSAVGIRMGFVAAF